MARRSARGTLRASLGPHFRPAEGGPIIGSVSPENETELAAVLTAVAAAGTPVVPKGADSSPHHGALADGGALVVGFDHMDRILEVDESQQVVTVEPGVLWQKLIDRLASSQLMPRVYPSSRVFSTVGGFVAQGGVGVGSFEFGSIDRSVKALRVLDAQGQPHDLTGDALESVVGAEGRTGLLTRVTLRLQPLAAMEPIIGLFEDVHALEACVEACAGLDPRPWSLSLIDPLASAVPSGDAGRPRQPLLPAGRYGALIVSRMAAPGVPDAVMAAIRSSGGMASEEVASVDRWIDRFMGLQVMRTTAIPLQFRLPRGALSEVLARIPADLRSGLGFEGLAVDGGQEVVLRFLLDKRGMESGLNIELANKLLEIVKGAGGRPYATGVFFLDEASLTYGTGRLERLRELRLRHDPQGLFNPGKGFSG